MTEPQILVEEQSPNGDVLAIAEDDGRVVYFYLRFDESTATDRRVRACWVRNRLPAPRRLDVEGMRRGGVPPLLPADHCRHPRGAGPIDPGRTRVVWFEEGDAAAFMEGDELLAVIPAWSGMEGFDGYARDCTAPNPLCWPLAQAESQIRGRVERAQEYWALWDDERFWPSHRDLLVSAVEGALGGPPTKYYGIDGGCWPPKAMLKYDRPGMRVLVTIGVSLRPQPAVEMVVDDPAPLRRIELAAAFDPACPDEQVVQFGRYVSAQSGYPWARYSWFGEGHTLPCDSTPPALGGERFPAVLLTTKAAGTPAIGLPPFRGEPVNVLWMVPLTASEYEFVKSSGSAALLERLARAGHGVVHRPRSAVA